MRDTIKYYEQNAAAFTAGTLDIEFSVMQDDFLAKIKPGASILDFGCGAGRDTKYFLEHGFKVVKKKHLNSSLVEGRLYAPALTREHALRRLGKSA